MSQKLKLTWQPGSSGRGGRWRKKYKGNSYYFPGGTGKSDREAYQQALEAWEAKKHELDRSCPRKHEAAYHAAIHTWEQVLQWCRQHGDDDLAQEAMDKVQLLRQQLERPKLKPLGKQSAFEARFEAPSVPLPKVAFSPADWQMLAAELGSMPSSPLTAERQQELVQELDGSENRIQKEIWNDRLRSQGRQSSPDRSLRLFLDQYLTGKQVDAQANKITPGRAHIVRQQLEDFLRWFGESTAVDEISGTTLTSYRTELLRRVEQGKWQLITARDRFGMIKSFVRWLWETEAIDSLPRVLATQSKVLEISRTTKQIEVFENSHIHTLLKEANDRTRLYILLMLNCGMLQKDIADLQHSEVDWGAGVITRKRSKTARHEAVPEVQYKLWPQTLRLLQQERSQDQTGRLLLNNNGRPLWEEIVQKGKYAKNDNIKNAFDRLRKKVGISIPMKAFRKTSATRLRSHPEFQSIRSLFLGHAPTSVADRHYAMAPQQLLDRAIAWLETEYGLVEHN